MPTFVKVSRPRLYDRYRRWTPTRPTLAFEHEGDVTIIVEVGPGLSASSVSGASVGGVYVRPAPARHMHVGVA
jgi:hypothetical protein